MNVQNTKDWIEPLLLTLFEPEQRMIDKQIASLHRANCEIKKQRFPGFIHMGRKFVPKEEAQQWWGRKLQQLPSLAFALMPQASELMKQISQVELDKSQIRQILFQQLQPCNTQQEIRDSLPECLIPLDPRIRHLDRVQGDPLFKLHHNKLAREQYHKILPKIERYAMSRMMY